MPFIRVSVPTGVLNDNQKAALAEKLTVEIMKIETDGYDTPGFRAISALVLDEVPTGAWFIGGDSEAGPAAVVEIRVPQGALSTERRKAMVEASYRVLTAVSPELAAVDGVRRIWTHTFEVVDWGAGGRVMTLDTVRTVASDERAVLA